MAGKSEGLVLVSRVGTNARGLKVTTEESTPFTALQRASPSWNSVVQVEIAVSSYCVLSTLALPDNLIIRFLEFEFLIQN